MIDINPAGQQTGDTGEFVPKKLYIGYMSNISKGDLLTYIREWTQDNFESKSASCYQILAWRGGFLYEIHEGGRWLGALGSVIAQLDQQQSVIIPTGEHLLRIVPTDNGVSTYILNDEIGVSASDDVEFKDILEPVFFRYTGFKSAGLVFGVLGIAFLLSIWVMTDVVYKRQGVPVYLTEGKDTPATALARLDSMAPMKDRYVSSVVYKDNTWKSNLATVNAPDGLKLDKVEMKAMPTMPPMPPMFSMPAIGSPVVNPAGSVKP